MENLKIESCINQLKTIINDSGLSIGVVYLIFSNLLKEIEKLYMQQINKEYNNYQKEQQDCQEGGEKE